MSFCYWVSPCSRMWIEPVTPCSQSGMWKHVAKQREKKIQQSPQKEHKIKLRHILIHPYGVLVQLLQPDSL
jgi:hypothetical protein